MTDHQTPFSVWVDFKTLPKNAPQKVGLPIWIESVERVVPPAGGRSIIRIRLRRFGPLNEQLQLRLFFTDVPGKSPIVTGWTETGSQPFSSPPLGDGLGLETSESLSIATGALDYLDIEVPGNGANLRGIFVASQRKESVWHALDFAPPATSFDPFGLPAPTELSAEDTRLFGRVRATIDATALKIDPRETLFGSYEFALERRPALALVTFEILGASAIHPIAAYLNNEYVGNVNISFPDLADPGYRGAAVPMERDLRFRYTGWLRAQVMLPGSRVVAGLNSFTLRVNSDTDPVAIRAVEIQLKQTSKTFDYEAKP